MLKTNGQRLFCVLLVITSLCLGACVTSPDLKLAQDARLAGNLEAAHNHYMRVLQSDPRNVEAKNAVSEIRAAMTGRGRQEAAALLANAPAVTVPLLRSSLAHLDQYRGYDPEGTYLDSDRKKYEQALKELEDANRNRGNQVASAIRAGEYSQAAALIDAVKNTDPTYPQIEVIETSYRKSYGGFLEQKIMKAYADNRIEEANAAMDAWLTLGFPDDEKRRLQAAAKKLEIDALKDDCRHLVRNNQYYSAFLMLMKSKHKDVFAPEFSELRLKGAPFYVEQARQRMLDGNVTRAYLEAVKGLELNPEYPGMFEMHRDTRDRVLDGVQRYIAIPAFGSPQDSPDVGIQFSDALISYLFRILPYGINIVERGKIDLLMEEHKREFTEVANILNVDLIVTGNVSLLTIDRQDTKNQSTVRVPVGEKLEINPEYEVFLRTSNEKNMAAAPPKTIKVKEYGTFTINKGKSTIKGFSSVAVRIFDTSKGRITYAQEFNANYKAEDYYQDGLDLAGIEGDPLELPSDTEIRERLRNQIVKQLADVIQAQFEKREKHFLENAQYYISRREKDQAVNELAKGFLYCVKAKVAFNDHDFTEIRNNILKLTEIDFL